MREANIPKSLLSYDTNEWCPSYNILWKRRKENQVWQLPLDEECKICGPHRTRTWALIYFTETKVDKHVITDKQLKEFTE